MKPKSEQAKQLNRKLTFQLLRDVLIYSALFLLVAFAGNAFLVPVIADSVAEATSEWEVYTYENVSLQEALDRSGGHIYALAQTSEDADAIFSYSTDKVSVGVVDAATSTDVIYEMNGQEVDTIAKTSDDTLPVIVVVHNDEVTLANGGPEDQLFVALTRAELAAAPIDPRTTLLLYNVGNDLPYWTTACELCMTAVMEEYVIPRSTNDTQVMRYEDHVAMRDLSTYNVMKLFKIPVAVILYLIGFAVILFVGFGRSLQYFDELSGAVGSLIAHRDQPVQLSAPLHATQEELNAIRVASLADERAAQAAERRKDELVAYLAHDVKTPITSIIGYLSLLDEAPDIPEEQRKRYVATALAKSERLEDLISEFFEITRYNLQAIPIERAQVEVQLFCRQLAEEFYPEAEARDLNIAVSAPEDATAFVDPDKFARALGNVLRNAIAHADAGSAVELKVKKTDEPIARWKFEVTDVGREISPAHLESIFDKFYRADSARNSSDGRAGLGLAIAKEIVLAHGGVIEATSENGQTTFTIYVPA